MKTSKQSPLKSFNHSDTLLVISLYPKKGETYSSGSTGVASYTKNLVTHLKRKIVILAEQIDQPSTYLEKNTLVLRCFQINSPYFWLQLLQSLKKFSKISTILVQYDFSMYGSLINSGLVLPFITLLKLMGKDVHLVSHHVITNVKGLSGHIGLNHSFVSQIKASIYNLVFFFFYLYLGLVTNSVIVLEKTLKERLRSIIPNHKIITIPHAVDSELRKINRRTARKELGIKKTDQVVMFFGYANWFKGADFFAQSFQNYSKLLGKDIHFLIAGGESPTMKNHPYYQEYFKNLLKTVYSSKRVTITGYVPQEKIRQYFSAADVVIFPYRDFMCASGVLSLVFSYQRPFIISKNISHMLDGEDFQQTMKMSDLTKEQISFDLDQQSLVSLTEKVLRNGLKKKLIKMGGLMRNQRSFKRTAELYDQILFPSPSLGTKISLAKAGI